MQVAEVLEVCIASTAGARHSGDDHKLYRADAPGSGLHESVIGLLGTTFPLSQRRISSRPRAVSR
jgi:hypothetical protein